MKIIKNSKATAAAEFSLVMPLAMIMIFAVIGVAVVCVRCQLAELAMFHEKNWKVMTAFKETFANSVLQDGDTPSPYCRMEKGYAICGYEK